MATWQDGPEYAPTARPDAFVRPDAAPLSGPESAPESAPAPEVAPPSAAPDYQPVVEDVVPLDRLAPPAPPGRDPREAFAVEATVATSVGDPARVAASLPSGSAPLASAPPASLPPAPPTPGWAPPTGPPTGAWGSVRAPQAPRPAPPAWAPQDPFQPPPAPPMHVPGPGSAWPPPQPNPSAFPTPQVPVWYQQHAGAGPTPPGPVTLTQMVSAATPALLITLAVAGIVTPLALPLYLVGLVLASRVWYRRATVRWAFRIGLAACLLLGAVTSWVTFGGLDAVAWWEHANGWSQLAAWAVGVATVFIQGDALRRNEPREPA